MRSKIILNEDAGVNVSNHTARQILDLAEKFYSDENNLKRFEKWKAEKEAKNERDR